MKREIDRDKKGQRREWLTPEIQSREDRLYASTQQYVLHTKGTCTVCKTTQHKTTQRDNATQYICLYYWIAKVILALFTEWIILL